MRLTLRVVVGVLTGAVVAIVGAVTLAITYTVSIATVRDIGHHYAKALASQARTQTENYFDTPTLHANTIARYYASGRFNTPEYDPEVSQPSAHAKYLDIHFGLQSAANFSYATIGIIMDEGSGSASHPVGSDYWYWISRFKMDWPIGNMSMAEAAFDSKSFLRLPDAAAIVGVTNINVDARFAAYYSAKALAGTNRKGMWYPITLYAPQGRPFFISPVAVPLYNSSGQFNGIGILALPIAGIHDFVSNVKVTPNTEAFAVDSGGFILGASHAVPAFQIRVVPAEYLVVKSGCATSGVTTFKEIQLNTSFEGCRTAAVDFGAFPPLRSLASSNPAILTATTTTAIDITVSGDNYFVVSTPVANDFRFWGLNIVLFMPEADVIGDIVTGRNTAIGVTVAVCFVACLVTSLVIYFVLRPLTVMSRKMTQTAKLRDVNYNIGDNFSAVAEIHDLQKAYTDMNTAIKRFTRYVPRDVVKDLMSTGQLCEISMAPRRCTMLFVDIASFTTICERVPPDVLSGLVSLYFDRASRIVMDHDGLIDKYIGDCIMAVWGAPFTTPNQEVKATLAGKLLDRETVVDPLAQSWDEAGEQLRVRVGISTGEVLAGNMGSAERMNYTVIGDPVNLSSRIEGLNKQFGTRVMVSEMTAEALVGVFVLRLLLPIVVVGKSEPVKVYEVMGLVKQIDERSLEHDRGHQLAADVRTTSSSASSVFSDHQTRRTRRTAATMVQEAIQHCAIDQPIVASDDVIAFTHSCNQAVMLYLKRDFIGARAIIFKARREAPTYLFAPVESHRRSSYVEQSLNILERLSTEYEQNCPIDFDGVYRADEK